MRTDTPVVGSGPRNQIHANSTGNRNSTNDQELYHYGVRGMKWGVRRATYRFRSAGSLERSKKRIEKDNMVLKRKATKKKLKAAKKGLKAAKYQHKIAKAEAKGKWDTSSINAARTKNAKQQKKVWKLQKKAAKAERTIYRNEKLMRKYNNRISELGKKKIDKGRVYVEERKKKKK